MRTVRSRFVVCSCFQEHYCPCDAKLNNHCLRGECRACPYAFACNCTWDVKSGISCSHVHAALLYALTGRRSTDLEEEAVVSQTTVTDVEVQYCSDEEEEIVEITIDETDIESVPRRRSTDLRDNCRELIQKMEMVADYESVPYACITT